MIAGCSVVPEVQYSDAAIDPSSFTCQGFGVSMEPGTMEFASSEEAALDYVERVSRGVGISGPEGGTTWAIVDRIGTPIGYVITQRLDGVNAWYAELAFECP